MIDNPDFKTQVFQAAERTNKRFGQWMPQRWLEIFVEEFIGEMMTGDQAAALARQEDKT